MTLRELVFYWLFSHAFLPFTFSQPRGGEIRELPSLSEILELHGKPTSHQQFREIARMCNLKLYDRREQLQIVESEALADGRRWMRILEVYGGSGLVVEVSRSLYIKGNLDSPEVFFRTIGGKPATEAIVSLVSSTKLIVGNCPEKGMFGVWRGEMPKIEMPSTPDALLAKFQLVYTDLVDMKYTHGGAAVLEKRRVMNYYTPAFGSQIPYTFEFFGESTEEYKLAMIWIWPENVRLKTIRPTAP